MNFETPWDRSIVLNKFLVKCPIEKFKGRPNSFLQISDETFDRRPEQIFGSYMSDSNTHEYRFSEESSDPAANNAANQAGQTSTASASATKTNSTNSSSSSTSKDDESAGLQTLMSPKVTNSEEAIDKIIRLHEVEKDHLRKAIKLVSDGTELVKQLDKMMSPIVTTDLKGDFLKKKIEMSESHIKITSTIMNELINKATSKLKKTRREYQLMKIEKLKLLKYEPYQEKYEFELRDVYDIFDHPGARDGPSTWSFTTSNLQGHIKAISQTSNIFCLSNNGCTATILTLKYKEFFDATMACSMLMRDNKESGIVFRYKDAFNYYAFEWSQLMKWKRIRKVVNGVSTVIRSINDGGFLQNIWYRVRNNCK